MKRINVFVGHYGSGKTEVAVNFAIKNKVDVIADLDIVNPYFRTNDAKKILIQNGIKVISPYYAGTNVDIPALPPDVYSVFSGQKNAVLDVGGDDDGAAVLGRFKTLFPPDETEVYFVVNVFRPETDSVIKIEEMIKNVEAAARLSVTALLNNANLMDETMRYHVKKGEELLKEVSSKTGIPFVGNTVMEAIAEKNEFGMKKYIKMQVGGQF